MALGWGWVERWLPGQRKSSPVQGLSEIKEQPDEGVRVSAVLPDWNQSPRLQSLNKCAKSAKTQPERERTGLGCSYGGGKWGQNRRQRMWQGCLGPGWAAAQEHNTKSARALWVGLPCFCSHSSGMWPPKITEQVPWHDSSECDKLAGQFIRISFVSTSLCSPPDRTERQRKVIDWKTEEGHKLPFHFPGRALQALSQASAGSVFEVDSTSHTPAHPAILFSLGGDPHHFQAAGTHATRPVSPTRSHPNSPNTKWGRCLKNEGTLLHQELLKAWV